MEINKIHSILLPDTDYQEFEQKIDRFDKKTFSTENRHFFTLISKFDRESGSSFNLKGLSLFSEKEQGRIGSAKRAKFLLNTILTSPNGQKRNNLIIKEISKKLIKKLIQKRNTRKDKKRCVRHLQILYLRLQRNSKHQLH